MTAPTSHAMPAVAGRMRTIYAWGAGLCDVLWGVGETPERAWANTIDSIGRTHALAEAPPPFDEYLESHLGDGYVLVEVRVPDDPALTRNLTHLLDVDGDQVEAVMTSEPSRYLLTPEEALEVPDLDDPVPGAHPDCPTRGDVMWMMYRAVTYGTPLALAELSRWLVSTGIPEELPAFREEYNRLSAERRAEQATAVELSPKAEVAADRDTRREEWLASDGYREVVTLAEELRERELAAYRPLDRGEVTLHVVVDATAEQPYGLGIGRTPVQAWQHAVNNRVDWTLDIATDPGEIDAAFLREQVEDLVKNRQLVTLRVPAGDVGRRMAKQALGAWTGITFDDVDAIFDELEAEAEAALDTEVVPSRTLHLLWLDEGAAGIGESAEAARADARSYRELIHSPGDDPIEGFFADQERCGVDVAMSLPSSEEGAQIAYDLVDGCCSDPRRVRRVRELLALGRDVEQERRVFKAAQGWPIAETFPPELVAELGEDLAG